MWPQLQQFLHHIRQVVPSEKFTLSPSPSSISAETMRVGFSIEIL
jgi:hypothetical protein